jgi:hypothetical protein
VRLQRRAMAVCEDFSSRRPWHCRHRLGVSYRLREPRAGQPVRVIAIVDRPQHRLHARFQARGKTYNKIVIAIGRELVGFVWAAPRIRRPSRSCGSALWATREYQSDSSSKIRLSLAAASSSIRQRDQTKEEPERGAREGGRSISAFNPSLAPDPPRERAAVDAEFMREAQRALAADLEAFSDRLLWGVRIMTLRSNSAPRSCRGSGPPPR